MEQLVPQQQQPNHHALLLRLLVSLFVASGMCGRGLQKGSLSRSGAAAAFAMGVLHMTCGWTFGMVLICFFLTSSKLTKLRQEQKAQLDAHIKLGGQRNARQVLCNSAGGAAAAVLVSAAPALLRGSQQSGELLPFLQFAAWCAFLGHYACCCADTWASELGMLSRRQPRLITQLQRRVPAGVNGGVTLAGFAASAAGGLCMGLTLALLGCASGELAPLQPTISSVLVRLAGSSSSASGSIADPLLAAAGTALLRLPPPAQQAAFWAGLSLLCGLAGSVVDSLLGATLQYSGFCTASGKVVAQPGPHVKHISGVALLSNDAVNATSAALSSLAAAGAAAALAHSASAW